MSFEHEQFISGGDKELERIRKEKIKRLRAEKEKTQKMQSEPVHVTDSNFSEIVNQNHITLIDFWAQWCGPCHALGPIIEELANEYAGKVLIGKLNVDENPKTAEQFQVFSIPTMVIMQNGREVDRIVGLVPKKHIQSALKKYLG